MFLNKVSQQFLRRPQFGSPIRSSRNIAQNINGNSSFGFQTRSKIDVKPRRSRLTPMKQIVQNLPEMRPLDSNAFTKYPTTGVTTLPNGLRVVSVPTHERVICLTIFIDAGYMYETDENSGVSRLLEKMAFKSTQNLDAKTLIWELEMLGGSVTSSSSKDSMFCTIEIPPQFLELGLSLIADAITHPLFDENEIEDQKQQVAVDVEQSHFTIDRIISDQLIELGFGKGPLARPGLKTMEDISRLTRKHLEDFHSTFYRPERMVIAATGIEQELLVGLINKHFVFDQNKLKNSKALPTVLPPNKYHGGIWYSNGSEFQISENPMMFAPSEDENNLSHIAIAFDAPPSNSPKHVVTSTLLKALGGGGSFSSGGPGKGMYSRLYERVLCGNDFVEAAHSFYSPFKDAGLFGVSTTVSKNAVGKVLSMLTSELIDLVETMDEEEATRAKNQFKSFMYSVYEQRSSHSQEIARQILFNGQIHTIDQWKADVDAITLKDLKEMMVQLLVSPPSVAIVSQKPDISIEGQTQELLSNLHNAFKQAASKL